jgi:hypothetical protein
VRWVNQFPESGDTSPMRIRDRLPPVDRRLVIGLGVIFVGALLAAGLLSGPSSSEATGASPPPPLQEQPRWSGQRLAGETRRNPPTLTRADVERTEPVVPLPTPTAPTAKQEAQARDLSAGVEPVVDAGRLFGLTRDGIRDAFQSQMGEVKDCYEAWLNQNQDLAGTMLVSFEIAATDGGGGGVTKLEVLDGGLGHALMEGCVLNALADVRFEQPEKPITVHYPLTFSSQQDDAG